MRRAPIRELLLGAGIALLVFACAGPPPARTVEPRPQLDPRLADISMMDEEIREFRRKLDLRSEPSRDLVREARNYSMAPLCPDNEPETEQCESTCRLAQDICDNAENICRIADDLRGNSWAAGKCDSARASCKEARQKCCGCNETNGDDDAAAASGTP